MLLLSAVIAAGGGVAHATIRPTEDLVVLSGNLDERLQLIDGWRYHAGDDATWAEPSFDDSSWPVAQSLLPPAKDPPGGWPGIGWFRRRLRLAEGMPASALAIRPVQNGASEIFFDGRLITQFGEVSADPETERPIFANDFVGIALEPGRTHVLAIRYSNSRGNVHVGHVRGFALNMRSVEAAAGAYHQWAVIVMNTPAAFGGAFAALAVLHLLLFFFLPSAREHLFFAAFSATIASLKGLEIAFSLTTDLITRLALYKSIVAVSVLSILLGLVLVHVVVRRRPTWPTWVLTAAGFVLAAWVWSWQALGPNTLAQIFFLLGFIEMLRVTIAAVLRRETDVWIIAVAFVPLAAVSVVSTTADLAGRTIDSGLFTNITMIVLGVAFSLFISLRAARTARELKRRLVEVEELSDRALVQERQAALAEAEHEVLEAENARRSLEMEHARRLQLAMLPHTPPEIEGLETAFRMITATEVGGDYVDLWTSDGANTLLAVGDATSHGLHAGMVVAVAKNLFQGVTAGEGPLGALERVGAGLQQMNERHASMAMVVIEVMQDKLRIASAGMPPVLILRKDPTRVEEVLIPGVPLGTLADATYMVEDVSISSGDTILVASDGLAEAAGPEGEPFGYPRIVTEFEGLAGHQASAVVDGMLAAVTSFLGGNCPSDDITLVVLVAR